MNIKTNQTILERFSLRAIKCVAILILAVVLIAPAISLASEGGEAALKGLSKTKESASLPDLKSNDLATIIGSIISAILAFVGLIFFILIIYAGFVWMTAGGNEEEVKTAISMMTRASIGLIIIAAAYLITTFVGETVIGNLAK